MALSVGDRKEEAKEMRARRAWVCARAPECESLRRTGRPSSQAFPERDELNHANEDDDGRDCPGDHF